MPNRIRSLRIAGTALLCATLLSACHDHGPAARPDAAFTPYIPAFTAGRISARAPILVRIAEGQRWKDTTAAALQGLFELSPGVQGRVEMRDERTVAFVPAERLQQDKAYAVRFRLGRAIEVPKELEEFRFEVATVRQGIDARVDEMQALSPTDMAWQRLIAGVHTSDDATGQDLQGCFTAVQEGRRLPLSWEHEPNGRYHRFTVDSVQRGDKASRVEISWDGKRIGSSDAATLSFEVPALGDLALIRATTSSEDEQYATLLFSDPLDPQQDLRGLVGIAGADEPRIALEGNKLVLYPASRLTGQQECFLSAGLRNAAGRRLGKDLNVELVFEELKPAVRFIGKGNILPSTDGLLLPFQAVSLKAVDVRVIKVHEENVGQFLQVNALEGSRELARVGRLISRKTISLSTADGPDLGRWNTYYLDLADHIKAEPGAVYRVELSFGMHQSAYPCPGNEAPEQPREKSWEQEQAAYDEQQDYWYYDDGDYYDYYDDYDYKERGDPCKASYYQRNRSVARNILASDIGLIAKRGNDGSMLLAASDLRTARPLSGVKLDVLDFQRRVMRSAVTGGDGMASVPGTPHEPFLLVARKGAQRGYLKLDRGGSLSVSSYDVEGQEVDKGLKGFLYGERGVWRPGDSLYLSFMLQAPRRTLPKDHPVVLEISDPHGRLDQKHVRTASVGGVYAFRCATPPDAPTGYWNAVVRVGGAAFHKSLRIETVKPNRLKVRLDLPDGPAGKEGQRLSADGPATVKLSSQWLHGAPARHLKSRVAVTLGRGTPDFKGLKDYVFNDLRTWVPDEEQVVFDGMLDAEGKAAFDLDLKLGRSAPAMVQANIVTRVFEAGGDASMDQVRLPYYPYAACVGIKAPGTSNPWATYVTDTTYRISVASVDANGAPLAGRKLKAQVYKLGYDWWWDGSLTGAASYISSPSVELQQEHDLTTDARGRAVLPFRIERPQWGRFAVRVTDPESGHASAVQLYLDWPGWEGRSRRQDPDQAAVLSFNADKEKYSVGERCTLIIPSGGTGRALVSLETGSRVLSAAWVDLKEKETRYSFPVTADMAPNAYAHVMLIQPQELTRPEEDGGKGNDLPLRLYGIIPIPVEDPQTHLAPVIGAPKEIRTDAPFSIEVSEKAGRGMTYTLAIVDEGLLDLTRFRTPDPWKHFYAREALGVRTWDLYDQVIGAYGRQLQRVLALGGSDDAGKGDAARANRFKPVVRFAGPFALERGKKGRHTFTISNYVGSVRVMAVATDGSKAYGSAEQAVPVRKPLMVLASLPRVLAPGETADLPVTVFAMDPKVKEATVRIEPNALLIPEGPVQRTIRFPTMGDQVVGFRVKVKDAVGVAKLKVTVSGAGETASEAIELQVRQPNVPVTEVAEALVDAGKGYSATPAPIGVQGTNSAYLEVSTIPPVDMGRRLQYLLDYPHGCLEQITSQAFPQLFLAQVMELPPRGAQMARANVEGVLRRLGQYQRADGSFNTWSGADRYDAWTSVYTGHFMVEAERAGYAVPAQVKAAWLAFQRKAAREWSPAVPQGWSPAEMQLTQAYRLYVLALAQAHELAAMNRLREQAGLGTMARWMLAAAYARAGRNDAARQLAGSAPAQATPYQGHYQTYGSELRDEAMIVEALIAMGDLERAAPVVQRIARRLSGDGWWSTQSTAYGLLAVSRLAEKSKLGDGMRFRLTVNGKAEDRFSERAISRIDLPAPDGKAGVSLQNTGQSLLYVRLVRTGTPLAGQEKASSSKLSLSATYALMDGTPLDPARIEQGTDFMAVVTVAHPGTAEGYQQLALTQVFPSGWEIRNTRLEGTLAGAAQGPFTYQDIRDDRVLTYFDLWPGRTHTYRVLLNASYTGRYYLPGAACEAMYDHTVNARSAGRWVEVVPAGGAVAER